MIYSLYRFYSLIVFILIKFNNVLVNVFYLVNCVFLSVIISIKSVNVRLRNKRTKKNKTKYNLENRPFDRDSDDLRSAHWLTKITWHYPANQISRPDHSRTDCVSSLLLEQELLLNQTVHPGFLCRFLAQDKDRATYLQVCVCVFFFLSGLRQPFLTPPV